MSVSPQIHPGSQAPVGRVPPAGQTRAAEKLVLLSLDESLHEALANVVPHDSLTVVADESALSQHLFSDHAGVAFIDAGALHSHAGAAVQLAQRLHSQLPDVVLVVAGDSAAQNELAALVAEGTVYRFVHKPVSAQRVRLFVEAAWRKRDGTNASGLYPTLSMPVPLPAPIVPEKRSVPWAMITAASVAIGAGGAWFVVRQHAHGGAAAGQQASAPIAPQRAVPVAVAPATPAASSATPVVAATAATATKAADLDRLATAAEQALLVGNLGEAARLTAAARAVDPDHVRVKFLTTQIAREQSRSNARRRPETPFADQPAPRRAPPPATVPTSASASSAPLAAGGAATTLAASVSSSVAIGSAPGSSSPAGATREGNAVIAMTLQRVHSVAPEFPDFARERDLSGYVDVEFTVLSDGSVTNVTVVKSQPARVFDKSATDAVRQWRYRPLVRNGVPTEQRTRVRLNFAYQ